MTMRPDLERELRLYLRARSIDREPDGLLAATLAHVDRTGQRPGWLVLDRWASPLAQARMRTLRRTALIVLVAAVALLAAALFVAVGSRPRLPKPVGPAGNGLIAFDSHGTIVTMAPDGSRERPITVGPALATYPTWSPDGTRIAYFEQPALRKPAALFVADADGSHRINVTAALTGSVPRIGPGAAWSPDGTRLAFTALTPGSPNGDLHIVVVGSNGQGIARVGPPSIEAQDPAWSPDGTRIAFEGKAAGIDALYVMEADGAHARRITTVTIDPGGFGDPVGFHGALWSPDGTRLVFFVIGRSGGNHDVYVVNADGTGERNITNSLEDEQWPAWSPDGRLIAAEREYGVLVMNSDGSDQRILPSDVLDPSNAASWPLWAPDGSSMAVYTQAGTIELLDIAGGPPVTIPSPGGATTTGSWQRIAGP
jgi:Tol biopolymer transport system component